MNPRSNKDILVVQENLQGHDLVIGDIHGSYNTFKQVLNSLKPNDRLFSVGDLTDKGNSSLRVIEKIIKFQKEHPNRLFVTRGNHENLCLNCIKNLETPVTLKILKKIAADVKKNIKDSTIKNPNLTEKEIKKIVSKAVSKYINELYKNDLEVDDGIKTHINNGGKWLLKLFFAELLNGQISFDDEGNNLQ